MAKDSTERRPKNRQKETKIENLHETKTKTIIKVQY